MTQNISTYHEFQGAHNFAVTAVLRRHTWQKTLHTHCIPASPLLLYWVHFDSAAPVPVHSLSSCSSWTLLSLLSVKPQSDVGICMHACASVCCTVHLCRGRWVNAPQIGCRSSPQLAPGWHTWADWQVRMFQEFCLGFVLSFVPNEPNKVVMIMVAYSGVCCLNCFSVWHLSAWWCHFWTKVSLIVALAQVETNVQSFEQNHGF